jgi:hypothetical protein
MKWLNRLLNFRGLVMFPALLRSAVLIAVAASFSAGVARAGSGDRMIEIGGGIERASKPQDVNVLLRVSYPGVSTGDSDNHLVLARVSSAMSLNVFEGRPRVPFLDIEFVGMFAGGATGEDAGGGFRAVSGEVTRNIRLDEALTVRVDLVGVQMAMSGPLSGDYDDTLSVFAHLSMDALGLKIASTLSERGNFYGGNGVAAQVEGGLKYKAGDSFMMRLTVGGRGDISIGSDAGKGFSAQSDMQAYAQVSADVANFVRLFVKGSVNGVWNSGYSSFESETQLMSGAEFMF